MGNRWNASLALACALAVSGCDAVFGVDALYDCPLDDDDCDELLDRVDPCPADPGDETDVDRDGVGDECDPNVDTPTDRLLEFESFATADARWMPRGEASFEVRDSALSLASGWVERAVPANRQPTVEVVVAPELSVEGGSVGVLVASKASTGIPLECRVEHHATGDELVMRLVDVNTGETLGNEIGRAKGLPGAPRDGLRIYGGQLPSYVVRCRARYGDHDALFVDWVFWQEPVDFDTIGLRVQNATAEYRSLAIYTSP